MLTGMQNKLLAQDLTSSYSQPLVNRGITSLGLYVKLAKPDENKIVTSTELESEEEKSRLQKQTKATRRKLTDFADKNKLKERSQSSWKERFYTELP